MRLEMMDLQMCYGRMRVVLCWNPTNAFVVGKEVLLQDQNHNLSNSLF